MKIKKKDNGQRATVKETLHTNLNFVGAEAYRLLRTNVTFALPGDAEDRCRVIGITSSVRGEGKSTTAINLSYALAEAGSRTLLIDCDMRLPSVAKKMEMPSGAGLSNYLVARARDAKITMTPSGISENWSIMTAGELPPNPNELLSSNRMKTLLDSLIQSGSFDYIILDLPPVTIVSDALVVSPLLDGMLVVVRENSTDKKTLNECVRKLSLASAKILGFVMTNADKNNQKYGKYKKYYAYY